ncbi:head-tail adaptor protein [Sphingomonas sp. BN140010]|uniref:Head-tail adaptor protein n=1 Tax=Sphingomonas arvum TaxID=2992113 RepID=A0ABT3JI42_9SPHN|nr:head-tail adaptor protein [Sphingomonas sp. BN140010]MCW3798619.1 head-tail adaptor protein [Sphingomonas sp. BN140010]
MSAEFAGTLTQRVELQRLVSVRTAAGLSRRVWETFASCVASVTPDGTGSEAEGMTLSALARYRVVIRARKDLRIEQRLRWRERHFLVKQIIEDPRLPDRIQLRCEEVRA